MKAILLAVALMPVPQAEGKQIVDRYRVWDAAYLSHDVKALAAMLDQRFTVVTDHGDVIPRKDYIAKLWRADLPEIYKTTILRVRVSKAKAIVMTSERSKDAGSPITVHRYQDTWVLKQGRWLMLESKTVGGH